LKGRLDLENFSGLTAEAVRQDFYAAVLLCNLESLLTGPANQVLTDHRSQCKYPQQVNRADSFHALKTHVLEMLYGDTPAIDVVHKLQRLFLSNPVSVRKERIVPRLSTTRQKDSILSPLRLTKWPCPRALRSLNHQLSTINHPLTY
jgi:hypothetical protein